MAVARSSSRGDRARDAAKKSIRILGAGEGVTHTNIAQMDDVTEAAGRKSAQTALEWTELHRRMRMCSSPMMPLRLR